MHKILAVSYGRQLFLEENVEHVRMRECSREVEELHMVVFSLKEHGLSDMQFGKLFLYPTNSSSRLMMVIDAIGIGRKLVSSGWIVTAQDPFASGLVGYCIRLWNRGVKLNIQEHGDHFSLKYWREESLINRVWYVVGKFLLRRADCVRVVSKRIKATLVGLGVKEEKISVVFVSEDLSMFESRENRGGDEVVVISGGRMVPQKNIQLLLESFASVVDRYVLVKLVVFGVGGNELDVMIERLGIGERVEVLPWVDSHEIPELLRTADVYALSSNYEGWCRMLPEAVAAGLPIVTTDVGCVGEVIKHDVHALVSPVGDGRGFEENLFKMVSDRELRERLSGNGREVVEVIESAHREYGARWVSAFKVCL